MDIPDTGNIEHKTLNEDKQTKKTQCTQKMLKC